MRIITKKKLEKMHRDEGIQKVYIDGNTVITKHACELAEEKGIDLILVKDPVINEKHKEVLMHPEEHIKNFFQKIRSY